VARRIKPETAVAIAGVRGLQVAEFRRRLDKLPAEPTDVYDFSRERDNLSERITGLEAGADVHVGAWELAAELLPTVGLKSKWERSGPKCFRIVGDEVMPEDYERLSSFRVSPNDTIEAAADD
jgi:hypothetical protein